MRSPEAAALHGLLVAIFLLILPARGSSAAEWQWSVEPQPGTRAFLWVPPDCQRIRAVVVGQHNMIEESILEHPAFRASLARDGIAAIWIVPPTEMVFRFDQGAGERFTTLLADLATESGYEELAFAPVVPLGHSACASYPWNFAAWNPGRTLAVLSVHGDAPLTDRTGSGKPNPDWGERTLDGVPGLMVMGEYEWSEDRILPALAFRARNPGTPLAMLPEPGRGHFDVSEDLVQFLALFIRKAVDFRLPTDEVATDRALTLRPVDPKTGWLVQRWRLNQPRTVPPAPVDRYAGDKAEAFWCFDEETARAVQNYRADQIGKEPQLVSLEQDKAVNAQTATHQGVNLRWQPDADGVTFHVRGTFLDRVDPGAPNLARWTYLPAGSPLGHATGGGPVQISRIVGPVAQTGPETFTVCLNRTSGTKDNRTHDAWLLASHPGDGRFKSAVQQSLLRIQPNTAGADQRLTFPEIPDQKAGVASLKLRATSDAAGAPVSYYVREGPAEVVDGDTLRFTAIPPRSRFPVKVTVVAWQWGHGGEPTLKTAAAVERTFFVVKPTP